jgi:hypothetical protein
VPDNKPERNAHGQYAPGTSGNPGGRPTHAAFSRRCRELVGDDGAKLAELAWAIATANTEKLKPLLSPEDAELVTKQKKQPLFLLKAALPRFQDRVNALLVLKEGGFGKTPDAADIRDDRYAGMTDADIVCELVQSVPASVRAEVLKRMAADAPEGVAH